MYRTAVFCLLVALSPKSSASQPHDTSPLVTTVHGVLRGSVIQSRLGRPIYSFRGVRFAQPPVGNLRFKAPVPVDPWQGIQNATEDGAACPQPEENYFVSTSEDCLFLNVYTTKLPEVQYNLKRPVMVFFHPGGFYSATGHSKVYGPQYLMDHDIVLVTTNYRLGALGFLSTGDEVLPGNYGMKDQVATLHWVKQNIAAFGGNPDSVTIAGYSVGSISVMLHMVSPMSQGLFHQGIAMSGSSFLDSFFEKNRLAFAKKQSALLNCPTYTSQEVKDCLMKKGAQEIASSLNRLAEWGPEPVTTYIPVIEPDVIAVRFLEADPTELFLSGKFAKVPLITGITKDGVSHKALSVILNSSLAEDMDNNFDTVAPIAFFYERNTERSHIISQELRKFYLKGQHLTNTSLSDLGELFTDAIIGFPEDRASTVISHLSGAPLYYYKFSYQGRYSSVYRPHTNIPYGVVHYDDQMYLFFIPTLAPYFKPEDPETKIVERQTKMWANFIQTGNPTPQKSDLFENVIWQQRTPKNLAYLDIGSDLEMKKGLYKERMAVWERLFPLPTFS
uniref:Female neotenic-specific protein 1 n=1 Tax=Cryptotermes secundus TaxID=105785 RepID=A6Y7R8_9NEOP|nr:female neotenic-specific protein 1 [Cryptotermes secundus]